MNAYKKTITIGLTILISICSLCGCGQETEVLYDPNTSGEETSSVTSLSSEDTLTEKSEMSKEPAETEPISYLRESAQEYLNMASENGGTINDGGLMCFWDAASESDEPLERNEYNLPVEDGTLELELNVLAYSMQEINYDIIGAFVFSWNGQIYDFSLGDTQSTNGMAQLDMQYWQDLAVPFKAEDLPIQEGDNTFFFWFFPYCEKTGYLTAQSFVGHYFAEESRTGREPILMAAEADLNPALITFVTDEIEAMTADGTDPSDRISFDGERYTLHENPTFHVNLSNTFNAEGSSNRSGIAMLFVDGQLQPVWNDSYYAAVFATEADYRKTYSVKTNFHAGEQHDVLAVYAEMQDDKSVDGDTFVQSSDMRCTIE